MSRLKRITSPMKEQNETPTKKLKCGKSDLKEKDLYGFGCASLEDLFDGDDDFEAIINSEKVSPVQIERLDLSTWQRCIVVTAERERPSYDLVLEVRLATNEQVEELDKENNVILSQCRLQQQWSQTDIKVDDIVSLLAVWDEKLCCYTVNNEQGFCVTNPDTLISSTSVVGSLFCRRRAVLQERFKGIDANSKVMVVGSMVHEMLQLVLQKKLESSRDIETAVQKLLDAKDTAYELYANLMTRDELSLELEKFVSNVINFVDQYIKGKPAAEVQLKDNFQGTIVDVQDIEENVWVPQLGIKGKIDVSVRIRQRKHEKVSNAIPLELKTGRATFSMEHKGQVILYQMMLSAIGRETNSSLLLYLREGIMRELRGKRNEQRDLIMLRNDLANYISQGCSQMLTDDPDATFDEGKFAQPLKLPDPISHHSACGNCEYATICCTFAKTDPILQLRKGHPLLNVMQNVTEHLKEEDYKYFMHWCRLLAFEEQEMRKSHNLRALWTNTPEQRKKNGLAIIDLHLKDAVCEGVHYLNTFLHQYADDNSDMDLLLSGFAVGEYVVVSTPKRLAVAAGNIISIATNEITVSLERDLNKNYAKDLFIIDKHESQSGNSFNYTNVSLLLDNNERAKALRDIVVQRVPPTYRKVLPKIVATEGAGILKELNSVQRSAVLKALTVESYMLIKGLPGTGKTQTLVAMVRLLQLMGKSVLITSHTHSAVDNLLVRLKSYKLPMVRLGAGVRINAELQEFGESTLLKDCHTVEAITHCYNSFNIVGVTCLGSAHPLFLHRKFDYCIVDEATQVMQPTTLRPLFFCDKFILVGDPEQLPPLIRSKEARQLGADESLFARLDTTAATAVLTLQYRMNKAITRLANELTYKGALQCATKEIEFDAFQLRFPSDRKPEQWLQRALQTHIDQAVFLLDTKDCSERLAEFTKDGLRNARLVAEPFITSDAKQQCAQSSPTLQETRGGKRISKYTNYCEAAIIMHVVEQLLRAGYAPERIGVIAPYRAQVELLRNLMTQFAAHHQNDTVNLNFAAIEVNTVDQYQGRDKDIILFSGTKTGVVETNEHSRDADILADKRRLTVAITRAKRKLLLIGDAECLAKYTPFHLLLAHIPSYCKLQLGDGKLGFDWQALFKNLTNIIKT